MTKKANWLDLNRPVGSESRKSFADKVASGFFDRYLSGDAILEIGFRGEIDDAVPIVPQAKGIDIDYPDYDGIHLPFSDESYDAVYSSHCLEHIVESRSALLEWYRVLKTGRYLIIVVPHQFLFEKRTAPPSRVLGHIRFYTPSSLLREIEETYPPNSYRIRYLVDNDKNYNYHYSKDPHYVTGCYEIELVIEKIRKPSWNLYDGTTRLYSPSEFFTRGSSNRFSIELDFSITDTCLIWGPYVRLQPGTYEAEFNLTGDNLPNSLASTITVDVARDMNRISDLELNAEMLRGGSAKLRFSVDNNGSIFEFRLYSTGIPFNGRLKFGGVFLDYA